MDIPTSREVVAYLNERFAARGLAYRVEYLDVLPYMNPMWLSNWAIPAADEIPESAAVEEEVREARWRFPQIYE